MPQHTPGPWDTAPTGEPDWEFGVCDAGGTIICRFDLWKGDAEDEQWANASLIAAAPQMLEALQLIRDTTPANHMTGDTYSALINAIAAATNP